MTGADAAPGPGHGSLDALRGVEPTGPDPRPTPGQGPGAGAPDVDLGLRRVVQDGVATQVMATLTGGPFLIAFALLLGADAFTIGVLAAIGPLAQLAQVPGVWLVERVRDRRRITLLAAAAGRVFWLAIAAVAFLGPGPTALRLLVAAFLANALLGGVSVTAWNSWMRDLVPEHRIGSFFSHRLTLMTLASMPLLLLAGWGVDAWGRLDPDRALLPYSVLFALGFLAGAVGLVFLARTPEPPMEPSPERPPFLRVLTDPLRDRNFRHLVHFLVAWNFAINLAAPFFTVYMLQQIGLGMGPIIALLVLSQAVHVVFLRWWGRYADHFGHRSVLAVSGTLFLVTVLLWTFTTLPEPTPFTLPLLGLIHVGLGASTAGFVLAASNLSLKLAPRGQSTTYLASSSMATAVAAGVAPLLGGLFIDFFAERRLELTLSWTGPARSWSLPTLSLEQWDFFFALAVVFGLYALHRLGAVQEHGSANQRVLLGAMVSDMRQEMRNLSTVAGLRSVVQFPLTLVGVPMRSARRARGEPAEERGVL